MNIIIAKTDNDFKEYLNDNRLDITDYIHMKSLRDICGRFFNLYDSCPNGIGDIILWT